MSRQKLADRHPGYGVEPESPIGRRRGPAAGRTAQVIEIDQIAGEAARRYRERDQEPRPARAGVPPSCPGERRQDENAAGERRRREGAADATDEPLPLSDAVESDQ